ncbi:MAG: chemotaxis response regulator protein-glutamate methylesterase, partial [Myxococcales bacterium]|nr:chemotaxis response regulator protein-glutamate methylesterase [Myxococcales bacterium]
ALELGALDFVAKPGAAPGEKLNVIREELIAKVEMVQRLRPAVSPDGARRTVSTVLRTVPKDDSRPLPLQDTPRKVVVIAASTGGPSALVDVFSSFRSDTPIAVLVVQHMPARFTRTFAERLDRLGGIRVSEAVDGHRLRAGRALVSPGGTCVDVVRVPDGFAVRVGEPRLSDRYVPSADRALTTAAEATKGRLIAVVLTGMGDDGAVGVKAVKAAGGTLVVQTPSDALIDGMPRNAMLAGGVDHELPLRFIGDRIVSLADR